MYVGSTCKQKKASMACLYFGYAPVNIQRTAADVEKKKISAWLFPMWLRKELSDC